MSDVARRIEGIVREGDEADAVLRAVVAELASEPGISWAGIALVEDGSLELGPEAGAEDEAARRRVPVTFDGETVGELWVDGDAEAPLSRVALLIGPHCLVGWDTHGIPWGK